MAKGFHVYNLFENDFTIGLMKNSYEDILVTVVCINFEFFFL